MSNNKPFRTYRTIDLAREAGVHGNTVKIHEKIGFISLAPRAANGYRVFNDRHLIQIKVCRAIFDDKWLGRELRAASLRVIRAMAEWKLDEAMKLTEQYFAMLDKEYQIARTTAAILEDWALKMENTTDENIYTRKQVAEILGVTAEAIRSPIGRIPRSNAAPYTDIFTPIRNLYANLPESKKLRLEPKHFSFNVSGGRCERCEGAGVLNISMHFLPDVQVRCPLCNGKRFKNDVLSVKYNSHNISDILDMTINEAIEVFRVISPIYSRLKLMSDVGLGYLHLGQPATTLSGGEAQRVKLAKELGRKANNLIKYLNPKRRPSGPPITVRKIMKTADPETSIGARRLWAWRS